MKGRTRGGELRQAGVLGVKGLQAVVSVESCKGVRQIPVNIMWAGMGDKKSIRGKRSTVARSELNGYRN